MGRGDGRLEGAQVGALVGAGLGFSVGVSVGMSVGILVRLVGDRVGAFEPTHFPNLRGDCPGLQHSRRLWQIPYFHLALSTSLHVSLSKPGFEQDSTKKPANTLGA